MVGTGFDSLTQGVVFVSLVFASMRSSSVACSEGLRKNLLRGIFRRSFQNFYRYHDFALFRFVQEDSPVFTQLRRSFLVRALASRLYLPAFGLRRGLRFTTGLRLF